MKTNWKIEASTPGAQWVVVDGIPSTTDAARIIEAIVSRDGLRAADASGRLVPVIFHVLESGQGRREQ